MEQNHDQRCPNFYNQTADVKGESGLTISEEENGGCHGRNRHGPRGESGCG